VGAPGGVDHRSQIDQRRSVQHVKSRLTLSTCLPGVTTLSEGFVETMNLGLILWGQDWQVYHNPRRW